jgi:hypothetical protein
MDILPVAGIVPLATPTATTESQKQEPFLCWSVVGVESSYSVAESKTIGKAISRFSSALAMSFFERFRAAPNS